MFQDLSDSSRVWIYLADQPFSDQETEEVLTLCEQFTKAWTSHNRALKSDVDIIGNQMLVFAVDESQSQASGCSLDKLSHFIQLLERNQDVSLLNRMIFAWQTEDIRLRAAHKDEFAALYKAGKITDDTLVYNTLVSVLGDLEHKLLVPLKESWHANFV